MERFRHRREAAAVTGCGHGGHGFSSLSGRLVSRASRLNPGRGAQFFVRSHRTNRPHRCIQCVQTGQVFLSYPGVTRLLDPHIYSVVNNGRADLPCLARPKCCGCCFALRMYRCRRPAGHAFVPFPSRFSSELRGFADRDLNRTPPTTLALDGDVSVDREPEPSRGAANPQCFRAAPQKSWRDSAHRRRSPADSSHHPATAAAQPSPSVLRTSNHSSMAAHA
jgi:hypothetical protein